MNFQIFQQNATEDESESEDEPPAAAVDGVQDEDESDDEPAVNVHLNRAMADHIDRAGDAARGQAAGTPGDAARGQAAGIPGPAPRPSGGAATAATPHVGRPTKRQREEHIDRTMLNYMEHQVQINISKDPSKVP